MRTTKKLLIFSVVGFFAFFGMIWLLSEQYPSYAAVQDSSPPITSEQSQLRTLTPITKVPITIIPPTTTVLPIITLTPITKIPITRTTAPTVIITTPPPIQIIPRTTTVPPLTTTSSATRNPILTTTTLPPLTRIPTVTLRPLTRIPLTTTTSSQPAPGPGVPPQNPDGSVAGVTPQATETGELPVADIVSTDSQPPENAASLTSGGSKFVVTGLTTSSKKVSPGTEVELLATVTNIGNITGSYKAELIINGEVKETKNIQGLTPGSRDVIHFDFMEETPASYKVQIGEETTSIVVAKQTNFMTILIIGIVAVVLIAIILAVIRFASK